MVRFLPDNPFSVGAAISRPKKAGYTFAIAAPYVMSRRGRLIAALAEGNPLLAYGAKSNWHSGRKPNRKSREEEKWNEKV